MSLLVSLQRSSFNRSYAAFMRPTLRSSLFPLRTLYSGRRRKPHTSRPQTKQLATVDNSCVPEWEDFYVRARNFCNKDLNTNNIGLSQISLAIMKETFEKIEEVHQY